MVLESFLIEDSSFFTDGTLCRGLSQGDDDSGIGKEAYKRKSFFVATREDSSKVLDFTQAAFDAMSFFVKVFVIMSVIPLIRF